MCFHDFTFATLSGASVVRASKEWVKKFRLEALGLTKFLVAYWPYSDIFIGAFDENEFLKISNRYMARSGRVGGDSRRAIGVLRIRPKKTHVMNFG